MQSIEAVGTEQIPTRVLVFSDIPAGRVGHLIRRKGIYFVAVVVLPHP